MLWRGRQMEVMWCLAEVVGGLIYTFSGLSVNLDLAIQRIIKCKVAGLKVNPSTGDGYLFTHPYASTLNKVEFDLKIFHCIVFVFPEHGSKDADDSSVFEKKIRTKFLI